MSKFDCGDCHKCEEELDSSFFPSEEWKLNYYGDGVVQINGVWYLTNCKYYVDKRCSIYDEPFRPIQCQIYPCYINENCEIAVDFEDCPNAHLVDKTFVDKVKDLINGLALTNAQMLKWLKSGKE